MSRRLMISTYENEVEEMRFTLGKIQRDQRLPRILTIAIHGKSDGRRASQRTAKTDDAKKQRRHDPIVPLLRAPPKTHQADDGRQGHRDRHDQPEFGLVDAAVPPTHEADDDVANFACDRCAQYAAYERGDVDEAGLEGGEIVAGFPRRCAGFVDGSDGFGKDDQPADAQRVD